MSKLENLLGGQLLLEDVILVCGIALGVVVVLVILLAGDGSRRRFVRRLTRVKMARNKPMTADQVISVRRQTVDSEIAILDHLIKHALPRPDVLRLRLASAGLRTSLANYLLFCMILAGVVSAAVIHTHLLPTLAAIPLGIFAGVGIPYFIVAYLKARRTRKFIAVFPEAIDLMVRGLKSGLPITESIKSASEEISDPVGGELKQVIDNLAMGKKMDEALYEASARLDIQEFNFFVVALSIQSETGGNLAETLENLSEVLRRRRQLGLKIKALSSEAKASAYIIGSLPFVMSVMIYLTNSGYIMTLVDDPRGNVLIGLGITSFLVGAFVMYRMVKFEV